MNLGECKLASWRQRGQMNVANMKRFLSFCGYQINKEIIGFDFSACSHCISLFRGVEKKTQSILFVSSLPSVFYHYPPNSGGQSQLIFSGKTSSLGKCNS